MRYGPDDKFWCVTDPTLAASLVDICFESSPRKLQQQLRSGTSSIENLTIFADRGAAEVEAVGRLVALRAAIAMSQLAAAGAPLADAAAIDVRNAGGDVIARADLT